MDLDKMNCNELDELIKMASAAKERKIRAKKDIEWEEFSKAWHKIFKENDDIEIGYEYYCYLFAKIGIYCELSKNAKIFFVNLLFHKRITDVDMYFTTTIICSSNNMV